MAGSRLFSLLSLLLITQTTTAAAQEYGSDLRLFGQFILGLAGDVDVEVDTPLGSDEASADLDPTPGFGVGVDFGLLEYVALGGLFRFLSVSGEDATESLTILDLDPLPRFRYPFKQGEIYLGIPVGLSIYIPEEGDAEVGWNISFLFGGLYRITEKFGLFAEVGYLLHFYSTSEDVMGTEVDASMTLGQIGLSIGAAYLN